jgi:hypothetical protein
MNAQATHWTKLYVFTDERFMAASEKWQVLNAWKRFIRSGFRYSQFSQALYRHLIQHASFIAHYNRYGFWSHYFDADPENLYAFLNQFGGDRQSVEYGGTWWLGGPAGADLNQAMCSEMGITFEALVSVLNLRVPRVTESQRSGLAAAARAAFKTHEERMASVRQTSPGLGRAGAQLSLWDRASTPPVAAEVPPALELVGIGEVL